MIQGYRMITVFAAHPRDTFCTTLRDTKDTGMNTISEIMSKHHSEKVTLLLLIASNELHVWEIARLPQRSTTSEVCLFF